MTQSYKNFNQHIGVKIYEKLRENHPSATPNNRDEQPAAFADEKRRAALSIIDQDHGQDGPVTVADIMLIEILKRLERMRDIAMRAANLPLSQEERRICQTEIDRLKEEINEFSRAVSDTRGESVQIPDEAIPHNMLQIDEALDRISRMVVDWEERGEEGEDGRITA